jgi:acetylornithine/succinyldiaminopimelate/putrescine aminotransferase
MDLKVVGGPIVESCMGRGLLLNCTANTVLRFLPPLIVTTAEVDEMLETLESVLASTPGEGGDVS